MKDLVEVLEFWAPEHDLIYMFRHAQRVLNKRANELMRAHQPDAADRWGRMAIAFQQAAEMLEYNESSKEWNA